MSVFDETSGTRPVWRRGRIDEARRRTVLGLTGLAAGTLAGGVARAQAARSCILTPDSGEGPFYFDPELLRSDIAAGLPGAPMNLRLQVLRASDCAVLSDARVDVWQADALGLYSGYANQGGVGGVSTERVIGESFLRGTQFSDAEGRAAFRTVYPSWYGGRTPHIHFKAFLGNDEVVASQIFFPDEVNNQVFEHWEPYREHFTKRRGFNDNDMFLADEVGGVFAEVDARGSGFTADAVIVVDSR